MKVQVKFIKGITELDKTFECETVNDCARGILNLLYGYPVEDIAMDDAMIELLSNPIYYPEGNVGDLNVFISILADRYENLKFVSINDEIKVEK